MRAVAWTCRSGCPGRAPSADPALLAMLIDDLGPCLAAEDTAMGREGAAA